MILTIAFGLHIAREMDMAGLFGIVSLHDFLQFAVFPRFDLPSVGEIARF